LSVSKNGLCSHKIVFIHNPLTYCMLYTIYPNNPAKYWVSQFVPNAHAAMISFVIPPTHLLTHAFLSICTNPIPIPIPSA
jgi:hypothetical protein